ncbi:MAG: peptide-methionine (S)-S-oxide reductase [Nitrospirae bacterium]|nr:peptide-methionine (S)-S-oxide reductase [Nitrospirota bacterium]
MVRTRVGYAGGITENPTYHNLGDHTESIQIDYDPSSISYGDLLTLFWESNHNEYPSWSQQYKSIIFYHNDTQRVLALESKEGKERERGKKLYAEIVPFTRFYLAEDYHQKFHLRREYDMLEEFHLMYPKERDFINSTSAARVNGYLAGYGTYAALTRELGSLGLSERAEKKLLDIARTYQQREWKSACQIR